MTDDGIVKTRVEDHRDDVMETSGHRSGTRCGGKSDAPLAEGIGRAMNVRE